MIIDDALAYGRSHLHTSPTPHLDARLLLEHILQVNHAYLVAHGDEALTAVQTQQYRDFITRAAKQEPIPYITGIAPFYGLDFHVTPAVLIPRPETEQLIELAIRWAKSRPTCRIADIGTGSGCIPITLATHLPNVEITAVDISTDALAIATQNATTLTPNRITFHQGNLLTPLMMPSLKEKIDLITANLPYITDTEWTMLDDGVKLHEPALALKGGKDGLDLIRELLQQATSKLSATGAIFLEIGWQQGLTAVNTAATYFPNAQIELIQDYGGRDRIVTIKLRSS
ncbi:MAG: peptide chain release factor N(5)-glutamine methyltransferase [Chloroflexi bacterium]|nr:peptide chain release factor N(5)-glutamine methyltransferase [Chloroflexota bacterium]